MPIQIISTYAPHNGHAEEDRGQHWEEVKEILNQTCKRHMIIWCTDANGQLGRDKKKVKRHNENDARSKIGPYTRAKKTEEEEEEEEAEEEGNDTHLAGTCQKHQMIPMAT